MELPLKMRGCQAFQAQVGSGRCRVAVIGLATPDGMAAYVYGGEIAHVGGLAVSGGGCGEESLAFARPTHKDHLLADAVAQEISNAVGQVVFVAAGFHVDNITSGEISMVLDNGKEAARKVVRQLKRQGGSEVRK